MKAGRIRASSARSTISLVLGALILFVSLMTWPSAVSGQDATPIAPSGDVSSAGPTLTPQETSTTIPPVTETPTDVSAARDTPAGLPTSSDANKGATNQ